MFSLGVQCSSFEGLSETGSAPLGIQRSSEVFCQEGHYRTGLFRKDPSAGSLLLFDSELTLLMHPISCFPLLIWCSNLQVSVMWSYLVSYKEPCSLQLVFSKHLHHLPPNTFIGDNSNLPSILFALLPCRLPERPHPFT